MQAPKLKRHHKTRRIFISLPADEWLTDAENETKWKIVAAIERLGYTTEIFLDPRGPYSQKRPSLAGARAWNAAGCEAVMRRCDGCVLLGFHRWQIQGKQGTAQLATDYNHYEGAIAHTLGLPLLSLVQDGVSRRVVFAPDYKGYVGTIPKKPTPEWLKTPDFRVPFGYWREALKERRDLFLGYCGSSKALAQTIKQHLTSDLGLDVLDWMTDFGPATSILHQIEEAARRCGAGIFLFTRDDPLAGNKGPDRAVPRDNVVFEAGYFCSLKGKSNVLIVLEEDTKMPADLGGDIYASLPDKKSIVPIKATLLKFAQGL
jgi:hypothetical protein